MLSAGIVGGTGYTGVELIRMLSQHPGVSLDILTSRSEAGTRVADYFPSLRGVCDLSYSDLNIERLAECDVVFFATPHGVAMKHAKQLLASKTKVIDLAADFRLQDLDTFAHWYSMAHSEPDLVPSAVYGLSEVNRDAIKQADIIGNPGCYPTTVLLGLQPLLSEPGLISQRIIVDAKSGVSGAGRQGKTGLIFSELNDSFKAYNVAGHRHHAEMLQGLNAQQQNTYELTFVPHLVPMIRGMFSTIYVELTSSGQAKDIQEFYENYYANEYFIDVMPPGSTPETRSVRASNKLRIALYPSQSNPKHLTILVVQDNLVKGAAGQAIQNMNIMFGYDEKLGLEHVPVSP